MRRSGLLIGLAGVVVVACSHGGGASAPARRKVEFERIPDAVAAGVKNPHDHDGKPLCQRCHVSGEEGPAIDPMSLCAQCHDPRAMKHPLGVEKPGGAARLPLLYGTEIACHTCHDPHDLKKYPHGLRDEYAPLCLNCHKRH